MKATRGTIGRSVDQPSPAIRFYLFHGQDEAQCRALGARLLESLGAARHALASSAIRSDPALLADEASAMSLFGGKRLLWIEPAGEEIAEGVAALLEAPAAESAAVAIAGTLRKGSALLKLTEGSPLALAFAAYPPEGQEAERMVADLGRRYGLKLSGAVAARLADSCGNDQAIAARELEKFALYLDASPNAPRELDHDTLDAVGADLAESDVLKLADLALSGRLTELAEELARLPATGNEAIPVIRSLQRRLLMLAPARARVERGERLDAVMASFGKSLFWKDKPLVERMVGQWSAADLATAAERAGKLERALIFTDAPQREALGEELLALARKARPRR